MRERTDDLRILEHERLQMEQIRQLDLEELQVEEVGDSSDDDDDYDSAFTRNRGDEGVGSLSGLTYNTCLSSAHSYLGDVDNTHQRILFLDGGAILNLPMFFLEGVVLFPEATLPLRVIQPQFIAAVERALVQSDAPNTIGVVRLSKRPGHGKLPFALTGTTAEIRQYRRLDDGSLNIVARGQQRFRLRRFWEDADGAPCGEVQIVQEDVPLRTPKEVFAQFSSIRNSDGHGFSRVTASSISSANRSRCEDADDFWDCASHGSITSDHSNDSPSIYEGFDEPSSGDEEFMHGQGGAHKKSEVLDQSHKHRIEHSPGEQSDEGEKWERNMAINKSKCQFNVSMSFLPYWAYQMYDSFSLARSAADLWRKIVGNPSLDGYIRKPDLLSFYIASKLPMSEATRQELLEIDGISYRLRREIELLRGFNLIRCKSCQTLIAKRSDMLVMSSDGPLNAYVNPHGFVHETITVYSASGLSLRGKPVKEHSWFPGYAWTIADCGTCNSNMGWLFTATKRNLLPKSFWGIRSAAVVDDTPR